MEDTETAFPADWAIEEALKPFNGAASNRRLGPATVEEVKREAYSLGYAASIIAHARLIEKFQPELRPADPDEEFVKGLLTAYRLPNVPMPNNFWDDGDRNAALVRAVAYYKQHKGVAA